MGIYKAFNYLLWLVAFPIVSFIIFIDLKQNIVIQQSMATEFILRLLLLFFAFAAIQIFLQAIREPFLNRDLAMVNLMIAFLCAVNPFVACSQHPSQCYEGVGNIFVIIYFGGISFLLIAAASFFER